MTKFNQINNNIKVTEATLEALRSKYIRSRVIM